MAEINDKSLNLVNVHQQLLQDLDSLQFIVDSLPSGSDEYPHGLNELLTLVTAKFQADLTKLFTSIVE